MPLQLLLDGYPERPAFDTALAASFLEGVSLGRLQDILRIHQPGRSVAFGRREVRQPGYPRAVGAARAQGFEAVERLAGGRAAVFHEGTIALSWARREEEPRLGIEQRFDEVAGIIRDALVGLAIDARVGEVPGEYCPGQHSVNAGGTLKLFGVGQRLVSGAVHLGGVLVVDGAAAVNRVLDPVYRHLGFPWRPEATGAVISLQPRLSYTDVVEAVVAGFASAYDLEIGRVEPETLARAEDLEERFRSPEVVADPSPGR